MRQRSRVDGTVVQASLGAMLVFYNATVVAYSLPFAGADLFQTDDRIQAALNTLALVAAGYAAKPFAQAVAGRYADRHGRRAVLVAASLLAGVAAIGLAVLPDVDAIGVAAPILFVAINVVQAASIGAEWPLLAVYLGELGVPRRRGYFTSYASMNVTAGWALAIVVALVLELLLTNDQYADWGWRITFLPAVALAALSIVLRLRLPESPVFERLRASGELSPRPLVDLFRRQAATWILCAVHIGMVSAGWFLTVSYPVVFVALADKFSHAEALAIGSIGLVVIVPGIWALGTLADRVGPRPISAGGFAALAVLAFPGYELMSRGELGLAAVGVLLVAVPVAMVGGVYEAWLVSSFRSRYTASSATANGVALALFGMPSLWLAGVLVRDHGYLAPGFLLVAAGVVGAITARLLPRSINEPLA
jgi:MFS transporter, MHS family, proline/betaine transporter